jgi:hypothetical protein
VARTSRTLAAQIVYQAAIGRKPRLVLAPVSWRVMSSALGCAHLRGSGSWLVGGWLGREERAMGWTGKREKRDARKSASAQDWYEGLSERSVLDEIKSAYESLSLTGVALHDQKTEAIVNAQMAAMKATLLVARRLDRVIELLEASAKERSKAAAQQDTAGAESA